MKQLIELTAGKPIYGGKCLSEYEGRKVMLERALPGEKVQAYVKKRKSGYIEAVAKEIIERSPHRKESDCRYYPTCGGCKLRDVEYDYQTYIKEEVVKDCVRRIGKVIDCEMHPIIKCKIHNNYRNKTEFTFSKLRYYTEEEKGLEEEGFTLGFHAPKFFSKAIDIDHCNLQTDLMNRVYQSLRKTLRSSGLEPYDVVQHTGFLRYMVIRKTNDDRIMINLITKSRKLKEIKDIADRLFSEFPELASFINTINSGLSSTAYGEESILIRGTETLIDTIGGLKFELSCDTFFQVNPEQVTKLYDTVIDYAGFNGSENVLDLYCGVGTIALYISGRVKSVTGFELVENAVINAKRNAGLNGISNCKFVSGDMLKLAKDGELFKENFDVIITDPPRDGMHPKVVEALIGSKVPKIVYVSCNPSTFGRDVQLLEEGGYKLIKVQPVDMFPHTFHVETVGLLVKNQE
ncbi:MAG TPA: 23S rRNA (uracil(1939)-C(5))-methyltransferase RlmD [Clostridiales bacterium]|nr:23S rRNA (uracil(1939)-C(5))-methyltransferase RlmD [Clostridiales bacterium]HQP68857.1 23S rRNA (uracil(1939)-C(5))-methyltransferase RlmD [Clostridiales bacterium]